MDFVDRVHGTGFLEIRPWKPCSAIPVEIVDVVAGTDSSCSQPDQRDDRDAQREGVGGVR